MRKDKVKRGGSVEIPKGLCTVCWEEADYADECRSMKKVRKPLKNREDCYVDFSDIVRK